MIIVEGMDGAGKSTLCKMLVEDGIAEKMLPSPRVVAKKSVPRMKYETERYMRLYYNKPYVVDRYLFSEMAYGPVLRGKSAFTIREYLDKILQMKEYRIPVIFCMPEKLNFKPDENPQVIEKQAELLKHYDMMALELSNTIPRFYKYAWDQPEAYNNLKGFLIW